MIRFDMGNSRMEESKGKTMFHLAWSSDQQRTVRNMSIFIGLGLCSLSAVLGDDSQASRSRPNILFISVDDLNDWTGCLGGHPQAKPPHLDRLAASGVLFTNAHAPASACNPSRTAVMTGIAPNRSGVYGNGEEMRKALPDAEIIPKTFSRHGYHSAGSGKILHYFIDANSWNDYFPEASKENPFPRTAYPVKRPLSLPRKGDWQYVETDWGGLPVSDEEYGGDFLVAEWISEQLQKKHDKPFFLACGFYRPHEPWFVPEKYFDAFPLESIELPPGYRADDLDDLPTTGKRRGPNQYFAHIQEQDQWKKAIQGYLASISFMDTMLGTVLDALEASPHAKNTIVVLWSDHGWHLGEKDHWQKYTPWRVCTRVPLIIRVPPGTPGLQQGTSPLTCDQPVNLLSLFPTLLELSGLPPASNHDGPSLVPLLRNPESHWPHVSTTFQHDGKTVGISTQRWRYINYGNGDEELYDIANDPHEWKNLAKEPQFSTKLNELRAFTPKDFQKIATAPEAPAPPLAWKVSTRSDAPPSRPHGDEIEIEFFNNSTLPIKMFVLNERAQPSFVAIIHGGKTHRLKTRAGVIYQVTDGSGYQRGYFRTENRSTTAVIPPGSGARAVR